MLEPDLGKLPLRRVTTQRLDAYYASLVCARGLSAASIRHVHAVLRGSLGQAVLLFAEVGQVAFQRLSKAGMIGD